MNPVPWKYRNVVNPWQTVREIKNALKFIDKMIKKLGFNEEKEYDLLGSGKPDRDWS